MSLVTCELDDKRLVFHAFLMTVNVINQYSVKYTNLFRDNFINNGISNIHLHQVFIYNSDTDNVKLQSLSFFKLKG